MRHRISLKLTLFDHPYVCQRGKDYFSFVKQLKNLKISKDTYSQDMSTSLLSLRETLPFNETLRNSEVCVGDTILED